MVNGNYTFIFLKDEDLCLSDLKLNWQTRIFCSDKNGLFLKRFLVRCGWRLSFGKRVSDGDDEEEGDHRQM